jgi:hypothetical protein
MSDDNVRKLPVKFKSKVPDDLVLVQQSNKCMHDPMFGASFIVDASLSEVTCSKCSEKLNPMWVLNILAREDRRMKENREKYAEEMKRLSERKHPD